MRNFRQLLIQEKKEKLIIMVKAHLAALIFVIVALAITNFVYVLHETNKHHVNVERHPTYRPLFVRTTRMLPTANKTCGVGWEYRDDEERCARSLARGVDARFVREATDVCDDFYESSCGTFNEDPSNANETNLFTYVHRLNNENIDELLLNIVGADTASLDEHGVRVQQFYSSCVNRKKTREEEFEASRTLRALINAANPSHSITSYDELSTLWGYLQRYDTILPLEFSLELDPFDATRLIPSLRWSALTTSDSLDDVIARLSLIYPVAAARTWAAYVVKIEQDLAEISVSSSETPNFFTYLRQGGGSDFIEDWTSLFSSSTFNVTRFVSACSPDTDKTEEWMHILKARPLWTVARYYLLRLPDVVSRYTLETWLMYTKHAILYHLDNDRSVRTAYRHLYDAQHVLPWTRPGATLVPLRNYTCTQLTQAFLPFTVDRLYAQNYFTEHVRAKATEVARNIHARFVYRLQDSHITWAATKVEALRLDIGVSEDAVVPTMLLKSNVAYVDNVLLARRHHIEFNFRLIFQQALPLSVFANGLSTNTAAFYQHQLNGLTVSVGMLQPPIFSPDFSDALLYARLGVFVAHEMAHSIDKTGRLFNKDGTYIGGNEGASYTQHEQCLVDAYTQLTNWGNLHSGAQTLNENFADTLGMQIAYETFTEMTERSEEERRDFFRAYAQLFCHAPLTAAQEQQLIMNGRHALPSMRVNTVVSSVVDFNNVWQCKKQAGEFCPYFD